MRLAARSTVIGGSLEVAVERALHAMAEAEADDVDLLLLPELCLSGVAGTAAEARASAEAFEARGLADLAAAAGSSGVSVIVGRYALAGAEVVNRAELLCADGRRVSYDKIHRFDALGAQESKVVAAGGLGPANLSICELAGLAIGQATCFDLRFPALASELVERGAELLVAGAAWYDGARKAEQLELVARARAADGGLLVAVAAALGEGFTGASMVIAPDGSMLARGELAVAEVHRDLVLAQRRALPLGELGRLGR